jgi:hypothetical protein
VGTDDLGQSLDEIEGARVLVEMMREDPGRLIGIAGREPTIPQMRSYR